MRNLPAIASLFFRENRPMGHRLAARCLAVSFFLAAFFFTAVKTNGQCPVNLGFESGSFTNWQCIAGLINPLGVSTTSLSAPLTNRHKIYQKGSKEVDPYGKFPVVCPNGSNYSIRLGNDSTGGEIDGVSYTVTVPAGANDYSIIYNYAVVYQNPDHPDFQQPRFKAKVFDLSANDYISCSSFDFTATSNLPGFRTVVDSTFGRVHYKPWTSVSIKLLGYAGKSVRIEFTVNDCAIGAHFGYAYFDVSEDCGSLVKGNVVCKGPTSTILEAPYGFQTYNWFNGDLSKKLGTGNIFRLEPLPAAGTKFAVEIIPYPGSGCRDTLYTTLVNSPVPFTFKTVDSVGICYPGEVDIINPLITQGSSPNLRFNYFIDSNLIEFAGFADALNTSGTYYIRAANTAGCIDMHPIIVQVDTTPVFSVTDPPPVSFPQTANLTDTSLIESVPPAWSYSYSYWKDAAATIGLINPQAVQYAGRYYIKATSRYGCSAVEPVNVRVYIGQPPNAFSPNGDGINDVWDLPALLPYPQCIVDIYSRSGRLVFHSVGYNKPWDGKLNGKLLPMATYYYIIKGTDNLQPIAGSVTIIY